MGTGIGNRRVLFEVKILDPTDESRFAHGVLPAPQPLTRVCKGWNGLKTWKTHGIPASWLLLPNQMSGVSHAPSQRMLPDAADH